jgi:prepilin-type N-terminal cleavage/methylation domain-containing protein
MAASLPTRRGLTLVEVLVVVAIVGVLIALSFPALQSSREAARLVHCKNNLKQLGAAVLSFESSNGHLPAGALTLEKLDPVNNCNLKTGVQNKSGRAPWSVLILPFLGESARFDRFRMNSAFFGLWTDNGTAQSTPNDTAQKEWCDRYVCPSSQKSNASNAVAPTNYYACQGGGPAPLCEGDYPGSGRAFFYNGLFFNNSAVRIADVRDGASNVIMLGETDYAPSLAASSQWGSSWASSFRTAGQVDGSACGSGFESCSFPIGLCATMSPINRPAPPAPHRFHMTTFGSAHRGGCCFAMADGSIHFFAETFDLAVYQSLGIRSDGIPRGVWQP